MSGLLFLIPVALILGGLGLGAFLWALQSDQFEDLDGAANRILFDEPPDENRSLDARPLYGAAPRASSISENERAVG